MQAGFISLMGFWVGGYGGFEAVVVPDNPRYTLQPITPQTNPYSLNSLSEQANHYSLISLTEQARSNFIPLELEDYT